MLARPLEDEEPLDPAVARVQKRLRVLLLIAGLTLGLGLVAVFSAVIYRIVTLEDNPPATAEADANVMVDIEGLGLPAAAEVVSTALDGNRMAVTFRAPGEFILVVLDVRDMSVVSRRRVPVSPPSP